MAAFQYTHNGTFSADGDWTNSSNWPLGGIKPATGNEVVISNTVFDLTTLSGEAAINLDALTFDPTCVHKVGGSGDRLTIDIDGSPGVMVYDGRGAEAWFEIEAKIVICRHQVYTSNACVIKHQTATVDDIRMYDGVTRLDGGIYPLVSMAALNASARCIIDSGSTLTTVNCSGGTIECSATDTLETCNVSGGEFQHLANQPVTTLNIYGGFFRFDGAATIEIINQFGGYLDMSRTSVNRTITTYNGSGGILDARTGGGLTITTFNKYGPVQVLGGENIS